MRVYAQCAGDDLAGAGWHRAFLAAMALIALHMITSGTIAANAFMHQYSLADAIARV